MTKGILLVLISAASFGMMPVLTKLAYNEGVNLKTLLTLRFCIAALAIWLLWAFQARSSNRATSGAGTLIALVLLGAVGYVGQSFSYFTAVSILSASATGLLLYTYPILVALLAWLFFRERLTLRKSLALAIAMLGALMVLAIPSSLFLGTDTLGDLDPTGVAWGLAAAGVYSLYIITSTRFTATPHPIFSSAVIISSAALTYLAWATLSDELILSLTPYGWLFVISIALLSTVLPIATFFAGLRIVGPSRAAIISTVEPAVTVLLAALILNETLTPEQLLGGLLILAAVLALQERKH